MYYALDREVVAETYLLYGELMDGFWSPPPFMNSWIQHMHYCHHISPTYLFVN